MRGQSFPRRAQTDQLKVPTGQTCSAIIAIGIIDDYFQWAAVDKKKWREGAVVKGRNEPHTIRQVLEIVAAVKEEDPQELAEKIYENTEKVFFS